MINYSHALQSAPMEASSSIDAFLHEHTALPRTNFEFEKSSFVGDELVHYLILLGRINESSGGE